MKVLRWIVPGSVAIAVLLEVGCAASEPPDEIAEELEGVFVEAPQVPADVAMHRGDPARTGVYDTEGVLETPEAKWVFQSDRAIASSAVVVGDKVLFGSDDGNFYALDTETGDTVWTYEIGRQIRTSPLVADGVVYFGADDNAITAVNLADGEVVWRNETRGMIRSSPVIARGTILLGSDAVYGTEPGVLLAYDARTGLISWEVPFTSRHFLRTAPAVVDDTIFFASARWGRPVKTTLHALDQSSGDEVWTYPAEGWNLQSVAVGGGAVFFATTEGVGVRDSFRALNGRLFAVERETGELRWKLHEEEAGVWTSPAVTEDLVFIGLSDGRLQALDIESGEVEWEFEIDDRIGSSPTIADGLVYFGAGDGKVRAVDVITGQLRWEFQTDTSSDFCREDCGWIGNAPVISDGVLYIGNYAGYFYALEATSSGGE